MELHVHEDLETLSQSLAEWIRRDIEIALEEKGSYSFVLSGGSTPKTLYHLLASEPIKDQIDWTKVFFFMGDERYVPYSDDRHNGKMAHKTLLEHIPVPIENIFLMDTSLSHEESAAQYEKMLRNKFKDSEHTFDLVLLGMGDDGHTLSLFPGTEVVHESEKWVADPFVKAQDMYRITLTQPVVSKARKIVFLAAGEKKAVTLKEVLEGNYQPDEYPSQLINHSAKNVHWFVDEAAASQLKKS